MPFTPSGRNWLGLAAVVVGLFAGPSLRAEEAELLPRQVLFEPLVADPRWPHFSAAWHSYGGDGRLDNVGTVSFGDDFSLYQEAAGQGRWGIGFQAGVFAIFDLDAESSDLVNADYWVGVPVSWREGPWQARGRVFHQSSHLGDEFLLRVRPERVNLSYEGIDLKLSRMLADDSLRLYGGTGYLVHRIPEDLDPWSLQLGAEYRAPWTLADGYLRPVAAVDLQSTEEAGWQVDVSTRLGFELESPYDRAYRVLLTLEYFNG
ncbi:MAG TPA: DUF1207 domain-containing protein, partial [Candidatus Omnitrophota bacterium]|nr:DUF1207 domain-containing protein [Candidatus Omnitrophota bacterium]